jgi:hypothetical protein
VVSAESLPADVDEVACAEPSEGREGRLEVVVAQPVAARTEDARGRLAKVRQEMRRLPAEVDKVPRQQALDAVAQPEDLADGVARGDGRLDDAGQAPIDDRRGTARLPNDERPARRHGPGLGAVGSPPVV